MALWERKGVGVFLRTGSLRVNIQDVLLPFDRPKLIDSPPPDTIPMAPQITPHSSNMMALDKKKLGYRYEGYSMRNVDQKDWYRLYVKNAIYEGSKNFETFQTKKIDSAAQILNC